MVWGWGLLEASTATISWRRHKDNPNSSAGGVSVCLSVTLICIGNLIKDWKAAFGFEGRHRADTSTLAYLELH